ncbi:MAG TPA: TIGR02530 family flagellar biosynthesis protein [Solirubrobacteraceae bacterium]|nr:TIGR02530 family flagellar biosynthesis protein [Solirubrobacteraceae bacterium]
MTAIAPNAALVPPGPTAAPAVTRPQTSAGATPARGPSFADVLAQSTQAAQAPTFSRHALERVSRRGITLDQPTLQRLAGGMSRAATKGSRDAVVFVDNTAFVVSVPNNTVITAVGSEHMREHVFTNIDSAVIA